MSVNWRPMVKRMRQAAAVVAVALVLAGSGIAASSLAIFCSCFGSICICGAEPAL